MKRHGTMVVFGIWLIGACLAAVPAVEVAAEDGCFGTPKNVYAAGYRPESVAVGDLDGDGALDLAIANGNSADVSVLLNLCLPSCPADLDGNGNVGFGDLSALLGAWGSCTTCPADINGTGDGWVGFDDLVMLLNAWGPCS